MYNSDISTPSAYEKSKNKKVKLASIGVNTNSVKKSVKPYPVCNNTWTDDIMIASFQLTLSIKGLNFLVSVIVC